MICISLDCVFRHGGRQGNRVLGEDEVVGQPHGVGHLGDDAVAARLHELADLHLALLVVDELDRQRLRQCKDVLGQ